MNNKSVNDSYWDRVYRERENLSFNESDWRNAAAMAFLKKISSKLTSRMKVVEIGGGGGQISCYLARKHPQNSFSIIDFSKEGCLEAEKLSKKEGVNLNVYNLDFFSCGPSMKDYFDFLFSLGVVEHFSSLPHAIKKLRHYIKDNGLIFTLIPNMASPVYSFLCGKWDRKVLETHFLYKLEDLIKGHEEAGFEILESGYLYPVEFSILSMAFSGKKHQGFQWQIFLWLTRLSKAVHLLHRTGIKLPENRFFSPYIFVTAKKIS